MDAIAHIQTAATPGRLQLADISLLHLERRPKNLQHIFRSDDSLSALVRGQGRRPPHMIYQQPFQTKNDSDF